tara:strand:- start:49 stop:516 length:468 start_codon:yes stop_codon:yes gene_type:complete
MYYFITKLFLILTGAAFISFIYSHCMASVPDNLGLKNVLFSPCPRTPNCVSSQENNSQHRIHPINFEGSLELAKERLHRVINSMRGTRIITQDFVYWHVEFTTLLLRFIDDVEFYFDGSQSLIHVRSASRKGYWDLGVNRRRVETIRSRFEELTK